jgi:hypothetical protein
MKINPDKIRIFNERKDATTFIRMIDLDMLVQNLHVPLPDILTGEDKLLDQLYRQIREENHCVRDKSSRKNSLQVNRSNHDYVVERAYNRSRWRVYSLTVEAQWLFWFAQIPSLCR